MRAGNRHIHAPRVIRKTNLVFFVSADRTDEDHIPFLPLKTVHRIDGDKMSVRFEEGICCTNIFSEQAKELIDFYSEA